MLPELSPLVASDLICDRCGEKMMRHVVKAQNGRPLNIEYSCSNKATGCSYKVVSDTRIMAMQQPLKEK